MTMTAADESPVVLIVDDEQDLADIYAEAIGDECITRVAYGGRQALELMDEDVDIVLLDRRMPDLSGDEVLEEIHASGYDCQVVMVTAVDPDFEIIELGFDAYITKPISTTDLVDVIERTVNRATYDEQLREFFALQETKKALENEKKGSDLRMNAEYVELENRIETLSRQLKTTLDRFDEDDLVATIERTQRVATNRKSEERYRSLTEDVLDTSRVGTIILDASFEVVWANAQIEHYFDLDREDLLEEDYYQVIEEHYTNVFADESVAGRIRSACEDNSSVEDFECRVAGDTLDERWLEHWSKPIETGLYTGGRIEHYYDVTDRKERADTLETLHGATRELMQVETKEAIGEAVVSTAHDMLEFDYVAFYTCDDSTGDLRPVASTPAFEESTGDLQTITGGPGLIWQAFVDQEQIIKRELSDVEDSPLSVFDSALVFPFGAHGVAAIGEQATDAFTDVELKFARLLGANIEAALDRAEREKRLRNRDQELAERNEQLQRLDRVNTIIREIHDALVSADSRPEIEDTVCESLSQIASYTFVWVGEADPVTEEITPRTWAGNEQGYLDSITVTNDDRPTGSGPTAQAIETREPQVIGNLADNPAFDPWRREALNRGYRSVLSTPLVYEESTYGVLEVYADRPMAFDSEEQAVLAELGQTIGHAINAIERRKALIADQRTELEFRIQALDDVFFQLASSVQASIHLQTILPKSDDTYLAFFSVDTDTVEDVLAFGEQSVSIAEIDTVRERSETVEFKCVVTQPELVITITEQGAMLQRISVSESGGSITVQLPQSQDVRSFVETIESVYPDTELAARRERVQTDQTIGSIHQHMDDILTDRQHETLQVAYQAGFFEWPRANDGAELAEMLDISQPTFLQHLRASERKLIGAIMDE